MKQGFVRLDAVEITVIDEADHMADLGFLPAVTRILAATPRGPAPAVLRDARQRRRQARPLPRDEVLHSVDEATSPVAAMTHHVFHVAGADEKKELVAHARVGHRRRILFMPRSTTPRSSPSS
jgi:superfamily II DNA/RNA helicase